MSLLNLIRGKSKPVRFATATPATFATQAAERERTVASVASVAVAESPQEQAEPMTSGEETAIRAWLALIEETDPAAITEVIEQCQQKAEARTYFTERATAELPKPDPFPDDRRTCDQCANLIAQRCQAAKRGEIVASRNFEPIRDLPQRCEGYAPGAEDSDKRHGRARWPGLIQKRGNDAIH